MNLAWHTLIKFGTEGLQLDLSDAQIALLWRYTEALLNWNTVHNLTSQHIDAEGYAKQIIDCLAIVPYLKTSHSILDVGTGAGLPAVPLAIACPNLKVSAIDKVSKKIRFIEQQIFDLGLSNLSCYAEKVENLAPQKPFDGIISRAMTDAHSLVQLTQHLISRQGCWYLMKGTLDKTIDEQKALQGQSSERVALNIPGESSERHLLIIKPMS